MLGFVFLRIVLSGLLGFAPVGASNVQTAPVTAVDAADLAAIDFGDDAGEWANDGECDDSRFAGMGMGAPSDDHIGHDASDCQAVFAQGLISLRPQQGKDGVFEDGIAFGDDASHWANDGECDDPRFEGEGMTATDLLDADIAHDASDCLAAWRDGRLSYVGGEDGPDAAVATPGMVDFGDDAGQWSGDGECDDKRFTGPGMTSTVLLDEDVGHDASDCRAAWDAQELEMFVPQTGDLVIDGVNFGDDSGDWTNDNQCDDPRFVGEGMTDQPYDANRGKDASDCAAAWQAGTVTLNDPTEAADTATGTGTSSEDGAQRITTPWIEDGVDFGTDSGAWANDGECDDPRFSGEGMTATTLLDSDIRADASDCLAAWRAGGLTLSETTGADRDRPATGSPATGRRSIANTPGQR